MGRPRQPQVPSNGTIVRVDKSAGHWEAVPVSLIEDTRLAFDTRGFAVWLMTKPDRWEIRAGALPYLLKEQSSPCGHVGRDKARRFLRELEQAGYLTRTRTHGRNGCWIWRSVFSAVPTTIDGLAVDGSPVDGQTVDGKGVDIDQTLITTDGFNSNSIKQQTPILKGGPDGGKTRTEDQEVGSIKKIDFPTVLSGEQRASAEALLSTCPPHWRQTVLDEVAGVHRRGALRGSAIGLLYSLVQRAKAGTFIPSHAMAYRGTQDREARERTRLFESRSQRPATGLLPIRETAEQILGRLRTRIKENGQ